MQESPQPAPRYIRTFHVHPAGHAGVWYPCAACGIQVSAAVFVFFKGDVPPSGGEDDRVLKLSDAFAREGNPEKADIEVKDMCITEYNEAETLQMIREKGREEGDLGRARKTASNMRRRGASYEEIAEILELPVDMIRSWSEEAGALA